MINQFPSKIFIVDDDISVRRSLALLLKSSGMITEEYPSAEEFLESAECEGAGCIILDIFLTGKTGLDLQDEISGRFCNLPIIYISGQGDIPMSVRALKKGAVNFLPKPVDDKILLEAVEEALHISSGLLRNEAEYNSDLALVNSLTQREYQVFSLLITGMLNKQIAAELNIAEHTVKLHRGRITGKLGIKSVAEMVHLAEKLKISR